MKKVVTTSIALMSLMILSGCGFIRTAPDDAVMQREEGSMMKENPSMIQKQREAMEKNDTMMQKEEPEAMMKMEGDAMMQKTTPGMYAEYSEAAVAEAVASGKKVALFFHAPWCPTCKAADAVFVRETPPSDVALFKVDYDSNVNLRKKYGVTYQHTFVSLNTDMSLKSKSSGDKSYAEIEELF